MSTTTQSIAPTVIATWNANGLGDKNEKLLVFLEKESVSIMLETEIFLNPHVRCSRKGGRVAVFVVNCIFARQVVYQSNIEAFGVEVELSGKVHRFIVPPTQADS